MRQYVIRTRNLRENCEEREKEIATGFSLFITRAEGADRTRQRREGRKEER
jgi:hypothetical protein